MLLEFKFVNAAVRNKMEDQLQFGSIKEQVYQEKLAHLRGQLELLSNGKHPEFIAGVQELEKKYTERKEFNEIIKELEAERINRDYATEQQAVAQEFADKKAELLDSLTSELEEKKKLIEHEYQTMEISGDCLDLKPMSTRKLRRRPNEPIPKDEKRQRKASPSVQFLLTETELEEDLRTLGVTPDNSIRLRSTPGLGAQSPARAGLSDTPSSSSSCSGAADGNHSDRQIVASGDQDAHIECGKLVFEKKFYLRGQTVFVEATDVGKVAAVIQSISESEVTLKSLGENKRITINLSEFRDGRAALRKRIS